MFAEATATLQSFQNEVMGFIEEGEATMLGRSQGDLRRQEEQRSRLSKARHNLGQVPEASNEREQNVALMSPNPRKFS